MLRVVHKYRKSMIATAVIFAFVMVVIPTCRMVDCTMSGAMSWGDNAHGLGIFGTCGGNYVTNAATAAAVPPTGYSVLLAMIAAALAATLLIEPPMVVERIRVHASDPPPPPEDPRGERLRI